MLLKEEMVDLEAQENKSMKQFDLIYAMGCSYIQGSELNGLNFGDEREKYVENRFTEIMSERTNIPYFNDAVGGAGNDKIIRKTFNFVNKSIRKGQKLLVILGLSELTRNELWSPKEEKYLKLNFPHARSMFQDKGLTKMEEYNCWNAFRTYMKKYYTESKDIEKLFRNLKMLESFIKQTNQDSEMILLSSLCNGINHFEKHFNFLRFNRLGETWSMYDKRHNRKKQYGHPNEESHKILADKLLDFIQNNL